jgi:hypothetical protein
VRDVSASCFSARNSARAAAVVDERVSSSESESVDIVVDLHGNF